MQLTSHKDISYILYFCKHETEYTRSLSDQTIQMVHIGYAYHRAFLRKTRIRIAGCVYPEECLILLTSIPLLLFVFQKDNQRRDRTFASI